jgi:hypothetical protein
LVGVVSSPAGGVALVTELVERSAEGWVPAFEGQRPPFAVGNTASLVSGVYSPRTYEPMAQELVEYLLGPAVQEHSAAGYLADPSFRPKLWRLATVDARCQLQLKRLVAHEQEKGCTGCRSCDGWQRQLLEWSKLAKGLEQDLGLDPMSRARLMKDGAEASRTVFDLERVKAAGAETRLGSAEVLEQEPESGDG